MKGCMEEDTDLDAKMLPFARCTMHLETAMCVCGGGDRRACMRAHMRKHACVCWERINTFNVNIYYKTCSDFSNIKI